MTLQALREQYTPAIHAELQRQLATVSLPHLQAAMQHLAGRGKLFRPLLVMATCQATSDSNPEHCIPQAATLELIHVFTLIHDDLPALDDAKLRRGKPAVHIEHGEALAILAGDGLLSLALQHLATESAALSSADQVALLEVVVHAVHAVIEGEMLDLEAESQELSLAELERLHQLKTGALIGACCEAGAILGGADGKLRPAMNQFGIKLGLAFQIRDDLLSVEGTDETTGKTLGADEAKGKSTYARLLGAGGARAELNNALAQIRDLISRLTVPQPQLLQELAEWACLRQT